MKVEVIYKADGTVHTDVFDAPRISTQQFKKGRANIILRSKKGRVLRTIQYRKAERIDRVSKRKGARRG